MGRLLGIDFGSKRIGLALSDPSHIIASPLQTIKYSSENELLRKIATIVNENDVEIIVVGYPIGMKGQNTTQTKIVKEFIDTLQCYINLPIKRIDERLSSVEAERLLKNQGYSGTRKKSMVDDTAAAIILQTYLDKRSSF